MNLGQTRNDYEKWAAFLGHFGVEHASISHQLSKRPHMILVEANTSRVIGRVGFESVICFDQDSMFEDIIVRGQRSVEVTSSNVSRLLDAADDMRKLAINEKRIGNEDDAKLYGRFAADFASAAKALMQLERGFYG